MIGTISSNQMPGAATNSDYLFDVDKFKVQNYGFGVLRLYEQMYAVENEVVFNELV